MAMPAQTFPEHPRPWTLEEVLALPEDNGSRVELVDGTIIVSPAPTFGHQRILQRVQVGLLASIPPEFELLPGINVVLNDRRLLIPDFVVKRSPGAEGLYATVDEIVLASEVLSPSTRTYDRVWKRKLYAEAGVPFYLVVDPGEGGASALLYELDDDDYREIARAGAEMPLRMERPFPATVDLSGGR
jgi:Uma2 family endonuclease